MAADAPLESATTASANLSASAMPFETPGDSFPGSAFYYLADPPSQALVALPSTDPLEAGATDNQLGELIDVGPSAKPFFTAGTGTSHTRALQCLAQAVHYEAASESEAGQRAVAQVVLNRVSHPSWPGSVCGVVYQGSQRSTGCQFTFTCDGSLARKAGGASWARSQRIAADALAGKVYAPIGHATHYHTLWVNPYWAKTLDHVGTIGAHHFYKTRGASGRKAAFTQSYAGTEPGVSGRTSNAPSAANTSAAIVAAPVPNGDTRATFVSAPPGGSTAATPHSVLANPSLSGAGQAKAEYSNAGKWKDGAAAALAAQEAERLEAENFAQNTGE